MKNKIKVLVLMGGKSPEHEISIISGREVVKNLDQKKYEILPVVISKNGLNWTLTDEDSLIGIVDALSLKGTDKDIVLKKSQIIPGVNNLLDKRIDVAFIAMHGPYGEDGTIQGLLELVGFKYTGSGVLASAIGMDKVMFRKVMLPEGIRLPKYVVVKKDDDLNKAIKVIGKFPYFVKPANQGSSVGASIVNDAGKLKEAVKLALKYGNEVLMDEFINGLELTCAVIGNENPLALPVIEIHPLKGKYFDYESKYSESGSEEIVPARIPKPVFKKVQEIAIKVYKILGCRGFGRVDFILKDNKYPVVLEINTIPGLTPMSLLPKAAKAGGISYTRLLDRIIKYSIQE